MSEGMKQDFNVGVSDPVIDPYIAVFYNSCVAPKEEQISTK